eukprot:scaffold46555_cov33-Tisochrysis_lutea.AAC.3
MEWTKASASAARVLNSCSSAAFPLTHLTRSSSVPGHGFSPLRESEVTAQPRWMASLQTWRPT